MVVMMPPPPSLSLQQYSLQGPLQSETWALCPQNWLPGTKASTWPWPTPMVKYLPATWKTRVWSLGWEDPLEKEMTTHSSTLAWKILWTEEPGRLQSMRLQRVRHDWAANFSSLRCYYYYPSKAILRLTRGSLWIYRWLSHVSNHSLYVLESLHIFIFTFFLRPG